MPKEVEVKWDGVLNPQQTIFFSILNPRNFDALKMIWITEVAR